MQQKSYITQGPEETADIASRIAGLLRRGDALFLKGDLGAGKSTFARSLIQTLCGEQTIVPSPTFTLVQTYETPAFTLWHFDLYRLKDEQEIYELGIEEALSQGVSLIEWPERLGPDFFREYMEIEFQYGTVENERILTFTAGQDRFW